MTANTPAIMEQQEREPLLNTNIEIAETPQLLSKTRPSNRYILSLIVAFIVLVDVGFYLQYVPLTSLLEKSICQSFYPDQFFLQDPGQPPRDPSVPDRCKDNEIQAELAFVRGWQGTLDAIPGLLTAIPYAIVADRHGRRPVLILAVVGVILHYCWSELVLFYPQQLSYRLIWVAPSFDMLGGGTAVAVSICWVIVSDIVSADERSTVFFRFGAAALVGELIANPIAAILMRHDPWTPILIGLALVVLSVGILFLVPETLPFRDERANTEEQLSQAEDLPAYCARTRPPGPEGAFQAIKTAIEILYANVRLVLRDRTILVLLFAYMLTTFGRGFGDILMQFATKRYRWSWSDAAFLLSLRAAVNLVLLLAIMPAFTFCLGRQLGMKPVQKELWLARASSVIMLLSALAIGLSTSPFEMILGTAFLALSSAFPMLVRSLATSVIDSHHVTALYSTISIVETTTVLFASPIFAKLFHIGLNLGGMGLGLPFDFAAGLSIIAIAAIFVVRVPTPACINTSTDA